MSAKLFTVPFQCVVVNGLAVPGATLTFYLTGTTTKTPVYTTSALTTEQTNPVVANSAGHITDTYLNDAITYRLVIKNSYGTVLDDIDPYIPGITTLGITLTTATGSSVSTRAALAAIGSPVANQVAFLSESGREGMFVFNSADLTASVTADTAQGIYVAPAAASTGASGAWVRSDAERLDIRHFGALGGGADDTVAITAAIASAVAWNKWLFIPPGTWEASALSFTAGLKVQTAGIASIIKQRAGTAANTRLITVKSNVSIPNGIGVEGQLNQAGDTTGEQNHGIFISATEDIRNVVIGPVNGTNLRGDVVLIYQAPADYTAGRRVVGVTIGRVTGTNIYRNGVSVCGARHVRIAGVECTQVGLFDVDCEPDAGSGPTIDVKFDHIKGSYIGITGTTAADYCDDIDLGHVELDSTYSGASTPAYPVVRTGNAQAACAILVRNTKRWQCSSLKANNYIGQAIRQIYNAGELATQRWDLGTVELTNICLSETNYNSFLVGGPDVSILSINKLIATTTLVTHRVVSVFANVEIGEEVVTGPASAWFNISDCTSAKVRHLTQTNGVGALSSSVQFLGGTFNGDTLFSYSGNSSALDMTVTATTVATGVAGAMTKLVGGSIGGVNNVLKVYDANTLVSSIDTAGLMTAKFKGLVYDAAGLQLLGARGAAVGDAVAAAAAPTQAEFNAFVTQFNLWLARARAATGHGLIS